MADHTDDSTARRIVEVLADAGGVLWRTGSWSVSALGVGVEVALVRALAPRVRAAVDDPNAVVGDLERALASSRDQSTADRATTTALPWIARRVAPLRAASRRTPIGFAVWAGPGMTRAIASGVRELGLVATELGHRAREADVRPDPALIQDAAVRIVADAPAAEQESLHRRLALRWVRSAVASLAPFDLGGGPSATQIAAAVGDVDVSSLGDPPTAHR